MNTLVLTSETAALSIEHLLKQVGNGGLELRDVEGNIVAFLLSPTDQEALPYAAANFHLSQHEDQVQKALARRGGITTPQLLANAALAAESAARQ
jgi:hypothetical protein